MVSARPTLDKIAVALLNVLDPLPNYPSGYPNHQDSYHLHHHDHHYYGGGAQPNGYYQNSNVGYPHVEQNSYPSQGPYPQVPYPQRPYYDHRGYPNTAHDVSVEINGGYQAKGYRHYGY
ncbi:protein lifeguard 1-like [Bactrocera neohumeralis]|uniref:protein lifeguard 1-like n=1 Tax=Bactrocera neohumeralis TaxID=98809 RepID=UPI002165AEEC|nr:protein lifeguard 1-like [Bactrocera neohumeralis]